MKKTELLPCWECGQAPFVDKETVFCANPKCKAHLPIEGRDRWNRWCKEWRKEKT